MQPSTGNEGCCQVCCFKLLGCEVSFLDFRNLPVGLPFEVVKRSPSLVSTHQKGMSMPMYTQKNNIGLSETKGR